MKRAPLITASCRKVASGLYAVLLLSILPAALVLARDADLADPLFQDNEPLDVTISAPIATLISERPKDEYLEGVFQYADADGNTVEFDLDIRTRGNFRHQTCEFPPITLNLKRKQAAGTLFDGQNKMKLVIQCDQDDEYEQMVLREYLAYRLLNALTEKSFRVRLLRARYIDTEDAESTPVIRYAFIIEHKSRLAKRLGLSTLKLTRIAVEDLQADLLNLTSLFQYMIGNTDFSPIAGPPDEDCCHNYVLFGDGERPILAIPYDFDQSGLVNAPYAAPNPRFRIRSVRQRLYRGRCEHNEYVPASIASMQQQRANILQLIEDQEGLQPGARKKALRYVADFYKLIDDARFVEKKILGKCV